MKNEHQMLNLAMNQNASLLRRAEKKSDADRFIKPDGLDLCLTCWK